MNKMKFDTLEMLDDYVTELVTKGSYVFDIKPDEIEGGFVLQWQEQKFYLNREGERCPDEVWVTSSGNMIQIQDMSENHAKNVLRSLIRRDNEIIQFVLEQAQTEEVSSLSDLSEVIRNNAPTLH